MELLCRQQLKPKRKLPSLDSPSSRKGKKKSDPQLTQLNQMCLQGMYIIKVPTETQGFHYKWLSGSFLFYLRIAQSLPVHSANSKQLQTSDCQQFHGSSYDYYGPWHPLSLQLTLRVGEEKKKKKILCSLQKGTSLLSSNLCYLLLEGRIMYQQSRQDSCQALHSQLHSLSCREITHVAELTSKQSWVKWQTPKKQCSHF